MAANKIYITTIEKFTTIEEFTSTARKFKIKIKLLDS